MPLYEYECQTCHRRVEKRQKFSDPELTECPHCGGVLERTITAPAFQFAGGGWYKDGYGSAKPAAAAESSTAASDSKPATEAKSSGTESAPSSPAPAAAPAASPAPAPASKT